MHYHFKCRSTAPSSRRVPRRCFVYLASLGYAVLCIAVSCGPGAAKSGLVSIKPDSVNLIPGAAQQFAAVVKDSLNQTVSWSVQEAGGGKIDSNGNYTAPAGSGTYHVIATSQADPTKAGIAAVSVSSSAQPVITDFSPNSGPAGTDVTIDGTNFLGATSVQFGGTAADEYKVQGNGTIIARVARGTPSGPIKVVTPAGEANSSAAFSVLRKPPRIDGFTPEAGPPGITVVITGANLGGAVVSFNGVVAFAGLVADDEIVVTVPVGANSGVINATTLEGSADSPTNFVVNPITTNPIITSFLPSSGVVNASVAIAGANLSGATSVTFNGVAANILVNTALLISTSVPVGATTGPVRVTTAKGTATSPGPFTVLSTPPPIPTITSLSPTSGQVGITVAMRGTNLSGAAACTFNGTPATMTKISPTEVDAIVPAGATTGTVTITTPGGSANSPIPFTVSTPPPPAPSIISFSPPTGASGTAVTVIGANFLGATSVAFNGVPALFTVASAVQITATVPGGASTGHISVTTPGGTVTSAAIFTVPPPPPPAPSIASFSPTSGWFGTLVTVAGSNFSGTTAVTFNGTLAAFTLGSDSQLTATVPSGATTGLISVTTPGGTTTSANPFTVLPPPPSIVSFTPTSGAVGTLVTVNGGDFSGATVVTFNGTSATFTVGSSTQLTATVPSGATTGPISITTPAGVAMSSTSFTVGSAGSCPVIISFSPTQGLSGLGLTGTPVEIVGLNLLAIAVYFNGTTAPIIYNSAGLLRVTVPAGATTGPITVQSSFCSGTSSTNFTVLN